MASIESIEEMTNRKRIGTAGGYTSSAMNIGVVIDDISGKDRQNFTGLICQPNLHSPSMDELWIHLDLS